MIHMNRRTREAGGERAESEPIRDNRADAAAFSEDKTHELPGPLKPCPYTPTKFTEWELLPANYRHTHMHKAAVGSVACPASSTVQHRISSVFPAYSKLRLQTVSVQKRTPEAWDQANFVH